MRMTPLSSFMYNRDFGAYILVFLKLFLSFVK